MMKLGFVLVLALAGAASADIEKRVAGSKSCKKERQYHVQIKSVKGGKHCAGSLLNTQWVITASHCGGQNVKVELDIASFFKLPSKKNKQEIKPEQQFPFKDEEGHHHDIMLIKLNEDASAKLPTIKLPSLDQCSRPEGGQQVEVGGLEAANWKKLKFTRKLKCASTEISTCGENDKPDKDYLSDETNTMCAFKPGVEACFGDSGSAVEYKGHLHGIIVSNPTDKCANPIVMLDICFYRKWIDETMRTKA